MNTNMLKVKIQDMKRGVVM